jgi:prepilin-type N-terminal cleavage/methylation domain-containing protein
MNRTKTKIHSCVGAFTLIELLIVVAIIAILAAIAVPNFLEAQVRAKVSRAKSDMRSLAVPLEAYAVDYNKYPPGFVDVNPDRLERLFAEDPRNLIPLTTPVSYITSLIPDPFTPTEREPGAPLDVPQKLVNDPYSYYNYQEQGAVTTGQESAYWALYSMGPDLQNTHGWVAMGQVTYDPTNGTVSRGDIFRIRGAVLTGEFLDQ